MDETMPNFNEVDDIPDDVDPKGHPLCLHRLAVNRREDCSTFTAGRRFLPARNQVIVCHRLHRPVVDPPLLEPQIEGLDDLGEDNLIQDNLIADVV